MPLFIRSPFCTAALAVLAASACAPERSEADAPGEAFVQEAERLADRLEADLKAELSAALSEVGPVGAIGVCQSVAPAIAQDLSRQSGWQVSRIARRTRNPANAFDRELSALYDELERAPLAEAGPATVHREVEGRFVYMRAIVMREQPCAMCHGTEIAPEIADAIAASYPDDRATGFQPGDLRGAILVQAAPATSAN